MEDYFVVGEEAPFEELGDVMETSTTSANGGLRDSVRRMARLRARAALEGDPSVVTCERCAEATSRLLEKRVEAARTRADLYAKCERRRAPADDAEDEKDITVEEDERVELDRLKTRRRALGEALSTASRVLNEAREERRALAEVRAELDRRQTALCVESNAFEWHLEAFKDRCAHVAAADEKRKRHRDKLHSLQASLARLDPDKASFKDIDAYLRSAARDLIATPGTTLDIPGRRLFGSWNS